MRRKYKILLGITFFLIVLCLIIYLAVTFIPKARVNNYKEIDKIKGYDYVLEDRDTSVLQENFHKLKEVLTSSSIDYKLYAEYLCKLFIIDLFTMDNKDSKYDIGGTEYVYPEVLENYELNVTDTLYKYLESKQNSKRDKYPIVSKIDLLSKEEGSYTYNKNEYKSYIVNLEWDYEEDLGYYNKGEVTVIEKDNHLYVVSFKGVE